MDPIPGEFCTSYQRRFAVFNGHNPVVSGIRHIENPIRPAQISWAGKLYCIQITQGTALLSTGIGRDIAVRIHGTDHIIAAVGDVYGAFIIHCQACGGVKGGLFACVIAKARLSGTYGSIDTFLVCIEIPEHVISRIRYQKPIRKGHDAPGLREGAFIIGLLVCVFVIYYVLLQSLEGLQKQVALEQQLKFEQKLLEIQMEEQK